MSNPRKPKWKKSKFRGVRYYEHPTRKKGIRKDRYYSIRYQIEGRQYEEGVGWATDDITELKAVNIIQQIKEDYKAGKGIITYRERMKKAKAEKETKKREALTFKDFFQKTYIPHVGPNKAENSIRTEQVLCDKWIIPIIGTKTLNQISAFDLERIKKNMTVEKKSPRTISYALAVIRQAFNTASTLGVYTGDNPADKVKFPRKDNRRARFLTKEQAETLLTALRKKSQTVYDLSVLSLYCGLRFGEAAGLKWGDIDEKHGIIWIRDTKTGRNRAAYIVGPVHEIFTRRDRGPAETRVFSSSEGEKLGEISKTFSRTVEELSLNAGITDPRDKLVFHSLRHTFASWLVLAGVDLYRVKELLGHSTLAMTERYSHLSPGALRDAVMTLNQAPLQEKPEGESMEGNAK